MQLEIPQIRGNETLPELIEYVAKLQKALQFLLSGKLSTDNIRELSADKVTAGMLNNVPIKVNLTDEAYIQIDLTGIDISNGAILTLEVDEQGETTFRGTIDTTKAATVGDLTAANVNVQSLTSSSANIQSLTATDVDVLSLKVNGQDAATADTAGYSLDYDSVSQILTLNNGNGQTISTVFLA